MTWTSFGAAAAPGVRRTGEQRGGMAWHGRRRRRRRQRRQVTWKESGPRIHASRREGRSYQFERNSEESRRAWFSVFRTNYSAYSGSLIFLFQMFFRRSGGLRGMWSGRRRMDRGIGGRAVRSLGGSSSVSDIVPMSGKSVVKCTNYGDKGTMLLQEIYSY